MPFFFGGRTFGSAGGARAAPTTRAPSEPDEGVRRRDPGRGTGGRKKRSGVAPDQRCLSRIICSSAASPGWEQDRAPTADRAVGRRAACRYPRCLRDKQLELNALTARSAVAPARVVHEQAQPVEQALQRLLKLGDRLVLVEPRLERPQTRVLLQGHVAGLDVRRLRLVLGGQHDALV